METKLGFTNFRIIGFNQNNGRFEFQIEASNINLDSYYTHFTERTLRNFARDAKAGVQFLDSHDSSNLGYGRTFNGRLQRPTDREPLFETPEGVELAIPVPTRFARAMLDVFTIPGINFGGKLTFASTDDFIKAVENELAVDVSVGFSAKTWKCDICGGNYLRYSDCSHIAGMQYAAGDSGERLLLSTVTIDHGKLHEVSSVYDGATPGAMVRKANAAIRSGDINAAEKTFLEIRYKSELSNLKQWQIPFESVPGIEREVEDYEFELNEEELEIEDERIEETNKQEQRNMEFKEQVLQLLAESNVDSELEPLEQIRFLIAENGRLAKDAEIGQRYHKDLVDAALAEGTRANGQEFKEKEYREILSASTIEQIKAMKADWERVANARFPNGRLTNDEGEEPEQPEERSKTTSTLPLSFYS